MEQTVEKKRLLALDVFRGMTIAGMILVNNPGTWSAIYSPLKHAEWHGITPTDYIFPVFSVHRRRGDSACARRSNR